MICPRCGAPIQQGAAVCGNCGLPMQWGLTAPQQQPSGYQQPGYQPALQQPGFQQAPQQPGYQQGPYQQGYQQPQAPYPSQMYQQTPPSGGNSRLWLWILLAVVVVVAIIVGVIVGTRGRGDNPPTRTTAPVPATSHFVPPTTHPVPSITMPTLPTISLPTLTLPTDPTALPTLPTSIPTLPLNGTLIGSWTNLLPDDDYQHLEFTSDGKVTVIMKDGSKQTGTYQITDGDNSQGTLTVNLNGTTIEGYFVAASSIMLWKNYMFTRDS